MLSLILVAHTVVLHQSILYITSVACLSVLERDIFSVALHVYFIINMNNRYMNLGSNDRG